MYSLKSQLPTPKPKRIIHQIIVNLQHKRPQRNLENIGKGIQVQGFQQIDQIIESYFLKVEGYNILFKYRLAAEAQLELVEKIEIAYANSTVLGYAYIELSGLYRELGYYDKALNLFDTALKTRKEKYNADHPKVGTSYHNLALVYRNMEEYDKALEAQQKNLTIVTKSLPINHPRIGTSYSNLSLIYLGSGDFEKAHNAQEKAINIRLEKLQADHPHIIISYYSLSQIYEAQQDYDKAIEALQKALRIQEKILPPLHIDLANSYRYLSSLYQAKGQYNSAYEILQKGLGIRAQISGHENHHIVFYYLDLVPLLYHLGHLDDAQFYEEKIFDLWKTSYSEELTNTCCSVEILGNHRKALLSTISIVEERLAKLQQLPPTVTSERVIENSIKELAFLKKNLLLGIEDVFLTLKAETQNIPAENTSFPLRQEQDSMSKE